MNYFLNHHNRSWVLLPAIWGLVGYCSRRIFGSSNPSTCWRQLSSSFSFMLIVKKSFQFSACWMIHIERNGIEIISFESKIIASGTDKLKINWSWSLSNIIHMGRDHICPITWSRDFGGKLTAFVIKCMG